MAKLPILCLGLGHQSMLVTLAVDLGNFFASKLLGQAALQWPSLPQEKQTPGDLLAESCALSRLNVFRH